MNKSIISSGKQVILGDGKKNIFFATNNLHKVKEVSLLIKEFSFNIIQVSVKDFEIQSDCLKDIAKTSAYFASKKSNFPLFVEDSGLFINSLNGFPGPYTSYVYQTLGINGLLKLLQGSVDRSSEFRSVVAYCEPLRKPICFSGLVKGTISTEKMGINGFGFDPIFKPKGLHDKTFAEIDILEKNIYSHRAKAIKKFINWYLKNIGDN